MACVLLLIARAARRATHGRKGRERQACQAVNHVLRRWCEIHLRALWRRAPSALRQHAQQPAVQIDDLLRAYRMLHRVLMPFDRDSRAPTSTSRDASARSIGITVSLRPCARKIGTSLLAAYRSAAVDRGQRQIARQADQAREPLAMPQPRQQHHRAALRKTHQHDARSRQAALALPRDQRLHARHRLAQARLVFALCEVGAEDVVPGAHHIAAVDRDRPCRRVRQHEAHRADGARSSSSATGTKSLPSAPSPCSTITLAVGCGAVSISMTSSGMVRAEAVEDGRHSSDASSGLRPRPHQALLALPAYSSKS